MCIAFEMSLIRARRHLIASPIKCVFNVEWNSHTARFTVGDENQIKQQKKKKIKSKKSVYKHWKYNICTPKQETPKMNERTNKHQEKQEEEAAAAE